jgi:glycosyltransferase involved in cell wall biosynthesis
MALKVLKRSKLVYDTHELETETVASHGLRKHLLKILERLLIRFVDETIVVNDSIAQWYKYKYRLKRVWVVRNVPYNQGENVAKTRILREAFGIQDEEIVYLYLGGISQGRGIPLLLDTFSRTHPSRHVVFMGFGHLTPLVQEYAAKYPNIHYHPAVGLSDVLKHAAGADVGLSLIENVCMSYYLCLPNKVFEYMMAGLPMIVSDFPDMAALVERYDCGWKVAVDAEALLTLVKTISPKEVSAKSANACGARCHFGWHLEEPALLEVYWQMLGPKAGGVNGKRHLSKQGKSS